MRVFSRVATSAVLIACVFALASCGLLKPRSVKLSETNKLKSFNCTLMVARKGAGDIVEAKFYAKPRATLVAEGGELLVDSEEHPVLVLAQNTQMEAPGTCVLRAFQLGKTTELRRLPSYHPDKPTDARNVFAFGSDHDRASALGKLMTDPRLGKKPVAAADLKAFQIAVWAVWNGRKPYARPALETLAKGYAPAVTFEETDYDSALKLLKDSGWSTASGATTTPPSGTKAPIPPKTRFLADDYLRVGDRLARDATTIFANQPRTQMKYLRWAVWCYTKGGATTNASAISKQWGIEAVEMPLGEVSEWLAKE